MNKYLFATLVLLGSYQTSYITGQAFITRLVNNWAKGKVTIQNTHPSSGTIVYGGTHYSNKQDAFDLSQVSSINYLIPPQGTGTLKVTVYDANNNPVSSADVQVVGNLIQTMNESGLTTNPKFSPLKTLLLDRGPNPNFALEITAQGIIYFPFLVTIRYTNGTGAPLQIGSPNCSLDKNISKILKNISSNSNIQHELTIVANPGDTRSICKLVATTTGPSTQGIPTGSQASMCITSKFFRPNGTDHCPNCREGVSGSVTCCDTDPFTGESVCTNEGIVWVRGNYDQINDTHTLWNYSIVKR